ncbi:MAG: DUF362 domain-containing protein [Chthoniobacterales bacterium]
MSTIAARLSRSIAFLAGGVAWAGLIFSAVAAAPPAPAPPPTPTPVPPVSVVYRAYDPDAIHGYTTNAAVVRRMVDNLVLAVTRQPNIASAWRSLVSPHDKVGIKISATGGEIFTTHRDVVNAIADGLAASGVPRANIIVWDRSLGGIKKAGYTGNDGYQLRSIPPREGYSPDATISAPFLGNLIWGDLDYLGGKGEIPLLTDEANTSSVSHLAKIVASEVTKIINVPVLSNSERNGLAGCLYNVTLPNIDNFRRFGVPPDYGASSIPEIYSNPRIGPKVVLNIMDGLLAEYAGGPLSQPNYAIQFDTIYASRDPVAIDSVAGRQIETWRKREKFPSIARTGAHIAIAAQMGLGNASPSRIEVRNVGR